MTQFSIDTKQLALEDVVKYTSQSYIAHLQECIGDIKPEEIQSVVRILQDAYQSQARIFAIGNGGSACTASHMATDFCKTVSEFSGNNRITGFRAIALTNNIGLITAWANDANYECIFAEQLRSLARPGDVLIAISASGNSPNLIAAAILARQINVKVIGLLGKGGGKMRELTDAAIIVPSHDYGIIEDCHLMLSHLLTRIFKKWLC